MKHTIHTPTEQYGFVETEIEGTFTDDALQDALPSALENHRNLVEQAKPRQGGEGLPDTAFRELYDKVAKGEPIQADPGELLESLNPQQRFALNEAKKFRARNK